MVKFQVINVIKSQNFLRGALPRTPPGYRPGPKACKGRALPPLKPPPGGPAPWTPDIQEKLIFLDMSGI